ncbi:MAG: hypothetical protein KJO91_04920 [Gammaproteobacteria bacterium]|nr:hypothetical protein [Gammaproteobacteria bacterium]
MEFFNQVHNPGLDIAHLKKILTINNLADLCASISVITPVNEIKGEIYCIWGAFYVKREELRYGVRFSLLNCPHALAWTVTFDEAGQNIIIHCTIDKIETDADFVESIHEFVSDWSNGIANALQCASTADTHGKTAESSG